MTSMTSRRPRHPWHTVWRCFAALGLAAALAACGGGSDGSSTGSSGSPAAGDPGGGTGGTGTGTPTGPDGAASAPVSLVNDYLCGIPLPSTPPGYGEVCVRPAGRGVLEGQVLPATICLGTRDCERIEAQVSLRTAPEYRGALTGKLLKCNGNPGLERVPDCTEPTRNDVNHLAFVGFRFDLPNGNTGPNASVTIQMLTSTDGVGTVGCTPRNGPDPFSDVTHLRIDDETGLSLFVTIRYSFTACTTD